jgi:NADPH2:quinone reductase
MKAWVAERLGTPKDVLVLKDVPELAPPGPRQVVVDVQAIALNMQEIDMIRGRYATIPQPAPFVPGAEVLGVVREAGEGAESLLGRRVVGQPRGIMGGYAERALMPVDMVFDAPDLPNVQAAATFWPFHVAWFALHVRGTISAKDTVLIHAGAGGVGSAAVQVAVDAGARVIATASNPEKLRLCRELGADEAIEYMGGTFADEILECTGGEGVDLAFDTVGGAVSRETWRCLRFGGRHLIVGFSSGIEQEDEPIPLRPVISKNISLVGCILTYAETPRTVAEAPQFNLPSRAVGERIHAEILDALRQKRVRPVVGLTVPFSRLVEAVDSFDRRKTMGRVVVTLTE